MNPPADCRISLAPDTTTELKDCMIPEIGHLSLWLALALAIVLGTLPLAGAQRDRADWMALSRPGAVALFLLVLAAYVCLTISFVNHDFSVLYVASNSNSALPLPYRLAAVWGGHEGSLLLWLLMLSGWMLAVAGFSRHLPMPVLARIISVMSMVSCGLLMFMLFTSNPFDRLLPAAADGRDLNPLLQDPGMVFHPPLLYMGYVGFSVSFAFAIAALIGGNLDATWARWTRPWTTMAWVFLTIGIALGSSWAYYELGWGGWWFWDPVENASFMPWLVGTALIHSLAVTEKRGSFKAWTVLLAIMAFSLSLLGTFLVRSGVLSSVHAFASDPKRGIFILLFLVVTVGASLALYAWRASSVGLGSRFSTVSKESALLANNVVLVSASAAVLLGTLYPLFIDALGMGKISVGPPYFDNVFFPLMAPALVMMGIGPLLRWKDAKLSDVLKQLRSAAVLALVAALLTGWLAGGIQLVSTIGLTLAWWVVFAVLTDLLGHIKPVGHGKWKDAPRRFRQMSRAMLGMMLAHLGLAAFCFGVAMVRTYEIERDVKMKPGDSTTINGYTFTFRGSLDVVGPNFQGVRANVDVTQGGKTVARMQPEKRVYRVQQNPMTEAAIDTGLTRDLYVALGDTEDGQSWIVRVYVKPFIDWIWGGCVLMAIGGVLAVSDRRYRQRAKPLAEESPT
jgi:cytochrome c-type biogenesis protein CcmF